MDNNNPISNPFDEDEKKARSSAFDTSNLNPLDEGDTSSRRTVLLLSLGMVALCCVVLVVGAFFYFKPNPQALIAEYFPSATLTPSQTPIPTATATVTLTPTFTPTPNLTATQQALDVAATMEAIQSTATQVA